MTEYDAWAPVYDAWAAHMTEDVAHYVSLAREADGPIVELAVGSGRVAIEVVRQTGKPLLGIDSSTAMLEIARERAVGLPLELRLGDMRDFELDEPADLIYIPFRSLLHLHGWHDKRRVFERVAASLRPGGRFAFNAFAFSHKAAARMDGTTQDQNGVVHSLRYVPSDNRSTSRETTAPGSASGGRRSRSGMGSSTSPGSRSRRSTAASSASRSRRSRWSWST